jgi:hypothetical protein
LRTVTASVIRSILRPGLSKALPGRSTQGHALVRRDEQLWSLDPTGDGCRFTFDEHVELPYGFLGSVLGALGQRGLRSHVGEMLVQLKSVAEA